MNVRLSIKSISVVLLFSLSVIVGCSSTRSLSEPIGGFRTATQGVQTTSKEYFLNMNRLERDFRFTDVYIDKNKSVDDEVTKAVFSADGIRARLKALTVIDLYSARLAEIVNADVDEKLTKNTNALGDSLTNLGSTIGTITGDETIKSYGSPIASLVKYVSSLWVEQERKKALQQAITGAAPEVEKILVLLENDLKKANDDRKEYAILKYNELRLKYNKDKTKLNDSERKTRIDELKSTYDSYETLLSSAPEDVIASMRSAHSAMIKMAEDLGNMDNFKAFVASVDVFSARVNDAAAIYKSFKDITK